MLFSAISGHGIRKIGAAGDYDGRVVDADERAGKPWLNFLSGGGRELCKFAPFKDANRL